MSKIRDKVEGDIIDIIFTNPTTHIAHEIAEQILSIPELIVVDKKVGLPPIGWFHTIDEVEYQNLCKAGWVREIK